MRPWAEHLNAHGNTVSVPRLPGHGTTWQEMNTTTWRDWYGAVSAAFDELRSTCDAIFVAGLSMGGCLALRLAEERGDQVAGLLLVNPSVASADRRLLAATVLKRLVGSAKGVKGDIKKPGVVEDGYDRVPLRALDSLRALWRVTATDLPRVTSPVLLFCSSVAHVGDPLSPRLIRRGISAAEVTEHVLENSYHVATLDNDAETIFRESAAFIARRLQIEPRDAL
jgi:carboxylesterase